MIKLFIWSSVPTLAAVRCFLTRWKNSFLNNGYGIPRWRFYDNFGIFTLKHLYYFCIYMSSRCQWVPLCSLTLTCILNDFLPVHLSGCYPGHRPAVLIKVLQGFPLCHWEYSVLVPWNRLLSLSPISLLVDYSHSCYISAEFEVPIVVALKSSKST
jgi:hypothetical protein